MAADCPATGACPAPARILRQRAGLHAGRHAGFLNGAERPLLVYFWASWCGVCRFTTPDVARLAGEGEQVITVAPRSGDDRQVARWLEKKKVVFVTIGDADGNLSRNWQVSVTPTIAVLHKGEIVSSTTGWTSYWGMKLRLWWVRLS